MKENLRIWAVVNDGSYYDSHGTDVTEAVRALYDLAVSSMDFGSGFWSAEDAEPVALLARVCGFERREEIEKYLEAERFNQEQHAYLLQQGFGSGGRVVDSQTPFKAHEHSYAIVNGKCLWPGCKAEKEA